MRHIIACVLLATTPSAFADTAPTRAEFDTVRKSAFPLERPAPAYPINELRRGQQGWVELSYVVTADGQVVDPIVMDSSGSRAFERTARRAVENFVYEPATVNGQAVQQCQTKVRISFALEGHQPGTVSRKFRSRYKRVVKAIDNGDVDTATTLLEKEFDADKLTMSEISWLWTLRTRLAAINGDKDAQLIAVRRATASPNWIDERLYPNLLTVRTTLEIENGLYADALTSFSKLRDTGVDNANTAALTRAIEKIEDFAHNDQVFAVPAEIDAKPDCEDCRPNWQYEPLRRTFRLVNVDGDLHNLELRCQWRRVIDKITSGETWSMPADWGPCTVVIFGTPGSRFELQEIPGV